MNTKEYIESGIIENYILGNVSSQERKEVECLSHIYPEIEEELKKSQASFETYLQTFKKETPAGIKEKIFAEINKTELEDKPSTERADAKIIPISKKESNPVFWKYSAAAGMFLFVTVSAFLIVQKNKNSAQANELAAIHTRLDSSQARLTGMSEQMADQNNKLNFYTNPENRIIAMKGLAEKDPASVALICWNTTNKEVYIDAKNLPEPPDGKQYQLWAMVDGKPVDLGVMDTSGAPGFHKMKTIATAEAFAVTLEVKGGSPVPNMSELYVIGNV